MVFILDTSLLFLLVKRAPFSWSDKMFSNFSLIRGSLFSVGMVLCPLLLTLVRWLGKDSLMILIGISASAVSFLLISNAQTTFEIFLRHQEVKTDHECIKKAFTHRWALPEECDLDAVHTELDKGGHLLVEAPKTGHHTNKRILPILLAKKKWKQLGHADLLP
ncbi:unnamed protein product [Heligmosomoides polygyrus]|uniref:SHSP domain-containing protein n=1 Tax=Heligmosomoides polygyrus TaxID=6339 RepID=A0A183GCY9_HELPZ|nr:unnamed protein product [Heligmosomoides polygyrus]